MTLDKVQQSRPRWNYTPVLQFFHRMIITTLIDAETSLPSEWLTAARQTGIAGPPPLPSPTDEALLARDWFATSEPRQVVNGDATFVSFVECCWALDLNADAERVQILAWLDSIIDFDTDEAWLRLERLQAERESGDRDEVFALPEWARVVPVIDQLSFLLLPAA